MDAIILYIMIASGLHSTTYGYSELMCGDIGKPVKCSVGAITASGEVFDPQIPSAAIFSPTRLRMWKRASVMPLRILPDGKCMFIRINDKGNPRYIGKRGFDLTPASVKLLGGKVADTWSGKVEVCGELLNRNLGIGDIIRWNTRSGTE